MNVIANRKLQPLPGQWLNKLPPGVDVGGLRARSAADATLRVLDRGL
jgi:hypothetical protein